ncbi:hypothetical protein C8R44DRAFT_868497 [Mycena epipterygia]|nr:hypothetical protein C8R44DRAFT_868497 [Mycena epipterygia]
MPPCAPPAPPFPAASNQLHHSSIHQPAPPRFPIGFPSTLVPPRLAAPPVTEPLGAVISLSHTSTPPAVPTVPDSDPARPRRAPFPPWLPGLPLAVAALPISGGFDGPSIALLFPAPPPLRVYSWFMLQRHPSTIPLFPIWKNTI